MIWKSDLLGSVNRLDAAVKRQAEQLQKLEAAYNDFFDAVAEDLGYEPKTIQYSIMGQTYGPLRDIPRQLARTQSLPEIIRKKNAK